VADAVDGTVRISRNGVRNRHCLLHNNQRNGTRMKGKPKERIRWRRTKLRIRMA
jgi:hypothetical protein